MDYLGGGGGGGGGKVYVGPHPLKLLGGGLAPPPSTYAYGLQGPMTHVFKPHILVTR